MTMKRAGGLWVLVLVWLLFSSNSLSQEKGFGIGVMIGEPTGLNGKYWVTGRTAIDGGLAWSFRSRGYLHMHADYLWHFSDIAGGSARIVPYVGVGGRIGAREGGSEVGIRIPVGLVYYPGRAPLDIFLELAPIVDLAPATGLQGNGGIGIRYYF
jgi:hypothetical protein